MDAHHAGAGNGRRAVGEAWQEVALDADGRKDVFRARRDSRGAGEGVGYLIEIHTIGCGQYVNAGPEVEELREMFGGEFANEPAGRKVIAQGGDDSVEGIAHERSVTRCVVPQIGV